MNIKNITLAAGAVVAVAALPPAFHSVSLLTGDSGLQELVSPEQGAPLTGKSIDLHKELPGTAGEAAKLQNCQAALAVSPGKISQAEKEKRRLSEPMQLLLLGVALFSAGLCRFRRRE